MRLFTYDGVRYLLKSDTEEAIGEFHAQLPAIKADIKAMRDTQLEDQKWFHRKDSWDIKEVFGHTTVVFHSKIEKKVGKQVLVYSEKKVIEQIVPAIEAYDIDGNFKGLVICFGGTFDPPYTYVELDQSKLDPFLWGQWPIYFGSKPFTTREEKFLTVVGSREIWNVPNTGEYSSGFDQGDEPTDISVVITGRDEVSWCCYPADWGFCSSSPCRVARYAYFSYIRNHDTLQDSWHMLLDPITYDFIGTVIPGTYGTTRNLDNFTGTLVEPIVYSTTFCTWENGPGALCPTCYAAANSVSYPPDPDQSSMPINMDDYSMFGTVTNSIVYDNALYDWLGDVSTNHNDSTFGGILDVIVDDVYAYTLHRTNGADSASECDFGSIPGEPWYVYGVSTDSESGPIYTEAVIVDGKRYNYKSVVFDYTDDPAFLNSRYTYAQYWGTEAIKDVVFIATSLRDDYSTWAYFHVNLKEDKLTVTEFPWSHEGTAWYLQYHSIPGVNAVYGNGYFRMVKVISNIKYDDIVTEIL